MNYLKTYKLSELYELSSGISTTPSQAGHGYPFCSFKTIFDNPILPEELPDLMDTSETEREIYSIKEGDVLLTRTSETLDELAMTSVALKDYPNATFSGFAKRLRPISNSVYPKFMAFFFRSDYFRKIINNKAVMTLRASFNENIFDDISFDLPPIEDQIKAGDFLFDIEEKIRNNNALARSFKDIINTIFDYWFIQFNFDYVDASLKVSDKNMIYNNDIKGYIPNGWKSVPLKDVIQEEKNGDWGEAHRNGNYTCEVSCIKGTDIEGIINGGYDTLEDRYILQSHKNRLLNINDYVVEISGTPGRSVYVNKSLLTRYEKPLIASNFCLAFSLKNNLLFWFDCVWKNLYNNGVMSNFSGKTTISNLLFEVLADSFYVALPPEDVLERFNNIVEPMYEMIQGLYDENKRMNNMRKFLINFFMTGQAKFSKLEPEQIKQVCSLSYLDRFNKWKKSQGYAARGDVDDDTLKKIFDAMDEDAKN